MPTFRETIGAYRYPATLVQAGLKGNIHRGAKGSKSLISEHNLSAKAYFNIAYFAYLTHPNFLIDGAGVTWGFVGHPELRNRFPATAHVRCHLELWGSSGVIRIATESRGAAGAPSYSYADGATFPCALAPFTGKLSEVPLALKDETLYHASVPMDLALSAPKDQVRINGETYRVVDDPGPSGPANMGRRLILSLLK